MEIVTIVLYRLENCFQRENNILMIVSTVSTRTIVININDFVVVR